MIVRVSGRSMTPTLHPGDFLWIRTFRPLQRGDIVLVRRPGPDESDFLKRIVGLPGERVEIRNADVWIDGRLLKEPYVDPRSALEPKADAAWSLGPDEWAVLGDARDDSADSRRFGPIPSGAVRGVAVCRLWPPKAL